MAQSAKKGFSKFDGIDLDDDEDERTRVVERAKDSYALAERMHQLSGSTEEVFEMFLKAEAYLSPLLASGLTGLRHLELETVLKGRLHQAVILAQLADQTKTDKEAQDAQWRKARSLVEDVLQFDFENSHARWLRGMALLRGDPPPQQRRDALVEMKRAVASARRQGRSGEADQWEAEITRLSDKWAEETASGPSNAKAVGTVPSSSSTIGGSYEEASRTRAVESTSVGAPLTPQVPTHPRVRKSELGIQNSQKQQLQEEELKQEQQRREHQKQQLDEVRQQRDEERKLLCQLRRDYKARRKKESQRIETLANELEEALTATSSIRDTLTVVRGEECDRVLKLVEKVQSDLSSSDALAHLDQERIAAFLAKIQALQEQSLGEEQERDNVDRGRVAEFERFSASLRWCFNAVMDLQARFKSLRPDTTSGCTDREFHDEVMRSAALGVEMRALPPLTRLWAFTHDVAALWLGAFVAVLGGTFALALSVEGFGANTCQVECATR